MASQRGSLSQPQESPIVKWIQEETDLPPETWKRLFLVVVKWLEARDPYLTRVLSHDARRLKAYSGFLTKPYGQRPETRAGLETMLQEMEGRRFSRGKAKQAPSVPYFDQFVYSQYVHRELKRRPRAARGQPEFVRGLINDVREKRGLRPVEVAVPNHLLDVVRHKMPAEAARSIVAHVCGGSSSYLSRKFVEVRRMLRQVHSSV